MLCGTRSFSDAGDDRRPRASSPRPKLSKLKQSLSLDRGGRKQAASSNPYANEGLDKFERLMAELEAKKEELLLKKKKQSGPNQDDDDSDSSSSSTIVRFKYSSDTGDWVPIVVRLQPKESRKEKLPIPAPAPSAAEREQVAGVMKSTAEIKKKKSNYYKKYRWVVTDVRRVWAVVIGVVLLSCCLVVIGRAFVVCSATVLWYMVPIMSSGKWDFKVYGKRLIAPSSSSSSSSSSASVNVKKMGSDHVILVSKRRR